MQYQGPQSRGQMPVVEDLSDDDFGFVMVSSNPEEDKALVVAAPQAVAAPRNNAGALVEAKEEARNPGLFMEHGKILRVGGAVAAAVAPVAGFAGAQVIAPGVKKLVGEAVEPVMAQKMEEVLLENMGLKNIPGAQMLVHAQALEMGHEAAELAREQVGNVVTAKSAAVGGALAGVGTVALLELANGAYYLYNRYVTPYFESYGEAKAQALAAQMQAEQDAIENNQDVPAIEDANTNSKRATL